MLLFAGCDMPGQQPSQPEGRFTPGVYQGVGQGYGGEITVELEVDGENIQSRSILSHNESRGVGEMAFEQVPARIIEEGAPYVESVAGATLTSEGVMEAAADALKKAGVEFKREEKPPESRNEMELYADILVVGAGGAGLTAAEAAFDNGAETVILLEKQGMIGGETLSIPILEAYRPPEGEAEEETPPQPRELSGYAYIAARRRRLDELGAEILTGVEMTELIVEDGQVLGALARGENTDYIINTQHGVILATGSYGGSQEMVLENLADGTFTRRMLEDSFATLYTEQSAGDGIAAAKTVGAAVVGMKQIEMLPHAPDADGVSGREDLLLISPQGELLQPGENENLFIRQLLALPGGTYYALADAQDAAGCPAEEIAQRLEASTLYSAESVEELARQLRIPEQQLQRAIQQYNQGRPEEDQLDTAPYYAAVRYPVLSRTLGGLMTDESGRVLGTDGAVIPGLYAAGSVTALTDDLGNDFRGEYERSVELPRQAAAAAMARQIERRPEREAVSSQAEEA